MHMTDADFLRECCIEPYDTHTSKRRAKEEFFIRRLGEIEGDSEAEPSRGTGGLCGLGAEKGPSWS